MWEIISIASGLIGIIGTVLMYKMNPRQKIYDKLDSLSREKVKLERQRDEALQNNNSDLLTAAGNELIKLRNEEGRLLQRLREINLGR